MCGPRVSNNVTMTAVGQMQALYAQHYLALVRLAAHLVDDLDSAEDVVQDVFAAVKHPPEDPLPYLRSAVLNRSRSVLRRRKVSRAFLLRTVVLDDVEPADADALRADRRRTVLHAIDTLPQRQREAVVLRYYEDLPVTEIAQLLGISPGAVSSSLNRALATLQNRLGDRDDH